MRLRSFPVLAAGLICAGLLAAPATGSAATPAGARALSMAHVNSDAYPYTWIYDGPYGGGHTGNRLAFPCHNFYYDSIVNGRYHSNTDSGWISTAKAGSGWCDD